MSQGEPIYRRYDQGPIGSKGLATMSRILDSLAGELAEVDWHRVSISRMASRGDFSPPAFYQYYETLEQAAVELYYRERSARRMTPHLRAVVMLLRVEHPEMFTG